MLFLFVVAHLSIVGSQGDSDVPAGADPFDLILYGHNHVKRLAGGSMLAAEYLQCKSDSGDLQLDFGTELTPEVLQKIEEHKRARVGELFYSGDVQATIALLKSEKMDVNAPYGLTGKTLFARAALDCHKGMAMALMAAKAKTAQADNYGVTPLEEAARSGNKKACVLLQQLALSAAMKGSGKLRKRGSSSSSSGGGSAKDVRHSLQDARGKDDAFMMATLDVAAAADLKELMPSYKVGDPVPKAVTKEMDIREKIRDQKKVLEAVEKDDVQQLKLLRMIKKCDVNFRFGSNRSTPLMFAAHNKSRNAVKFLLKAKANPKDLNLSYNRAIDYARAAGQIEIVALLVGAEAQ